jgi:hypothetical protein
MGQMSHNRLVWTSIKGSLCSPFAHSRSEREEEREKRRKKERKKRKEERRKEEREGKKEEKKKGMRERGKKNKENFKVIFLWCFSMKLNF